MGVGFDVEGALEVRIVNDPYWIAGVEYGEPRPGHPEGSVRAHIAEVLCKIESLYAGSHLRRPLRTVALIHDVGKKYVDRSLPKFGENHHGMIARRWAEKFISDPAILDVIEMHDEGFKSYCKGARTGKWDEAEARAKAAITRLNGSFELFLSFYRCDNATGDKTDDNYKWFCKIAGVVA